MDVDKYKDDFISEAREHLDTLNEGLLALEKDPANSETINQLFRAYHTLKGNAGMMGYKKFADVAHAMEDVLSKTRDGELKVTRNVADLLLEGCDLLEQGLSLIEDGDPEAIETEAVIEELHSLIAEDAAAAPAATISEKLSLSSEEQVKVEAAKKAGKQVVRLVTIFDPGNPLKVAKGMLVFRDISANGEVLHVEPSEAEIKAGKFGSEISVVLAMENDPAALIERTGKVFGVKEILSLSLEDAYQKPAAHQEAEKEHEKKALTEHSTKVIKQIQSVKVGMGRLDKLVNLVGELLISNLRLQDVLKSNNPKELHTVSSSIDRLILDLQDQVMEIRMVPISSISRRFPRLVRDLAEKEEKLAELTITGAETEFDRTILDQIGEPLVHLLRNSVDHGIESTEERQKAGKEPMGAVHLDVRREKNHAVLELSDDGSGIDAERVKESCIKKGVITATEALQMTADELQMLIFRPGVSTSSQITEVSGRGVGMDVVLSKVKSLGGSLQLHSKVGEGTRITIKLPLTVAILSALLVRSNNDIFAIPLSAVEQIVDVKNMEMRSISGHEVAIYRDNDLPILRISQLLGTSTEDNGKTVVIVNRNHQQVGLMVDEIVAQQQILIKALQEMVKGAKGCGGATILPDGRVVLVLDLDTLF